MSRIVVLCEGDTEEFAVRHFIARQWRSDGFQSVGLDTRNLDGKLQNAGKFAVRYLDDQEILAVLTLIDLQGNTRIVHRSEDEIEMKVERAREWLRVQVNHVRAHRFFPHVCVHQTEAWILAEGHALAGRLRDVEIPADPHAESKNFQNPPSKRLNDLFLRSRLSRRYNKAIDGAPLFAAMQFEPVYNSCRYFREFYEDLRSAALH